MIDYLLMYPDEPTARADPTVGAYYTPATTGDMPSPGGWRGDVCVTGMQFWDKTNDVAGQDSQGNPTVTHTFLPGFWLLISLPAQDPGLDASSARQLVFDYGSWTAGTKTLVQAVVFSAYPLAALRTKRFQPVFAGRQYNLGQAW